MPVNARHALLAMTLLAAAVGASAAANAAADAQQGRELYRQYCESCHGPDMVTTSKLAFDLRRFPAQEEERFRNAVRNGKGSGMPAWRDSLTAEDVANLWAYVRSEPK